MIATLPTVTAHCACCVQPTEVTELREGMCSDCNADADSYELAAIRRMIGAPAKCSAPEAVEWLQDQHQLKVAELEAELAQARAKLSEVAA